MHSIHETKPPCQDSPLLEVLETFQRRAQYILLRDLPPDAEKVAVRAATRRAWRSFHRIERKEARP